ncbi:hypothetical protein ACFXCZ_31685 [Streptomyces sp. NPDC059396]|uniref:hypothetical protein n=1 Tax=Streptomyces sp. NPDC059396 TaxID=3346819 RepID=UPI0036B64CA8
MSVRPYWTHVRFGQGVVEVVVVARLQQVVRGGRVGVDANWPQGTSRSAVRARRQQ